MATGSFHKLQDIFNLLEGQIWVVIVHECVLLDGKVSIFAVDIWWERFKMYHL